MFEDIFDVGDRVRESEEPLHHVIVFHLLQGHFGAVPIL